MNEQGQPVQWSPEQWNSVQQVVHDEALKSRVGARFLPLLGPLPADTVVIPRQTVSLEKIEEKPHGGRAEQGDYLAVDDHDVIRLTSIGVNIRLSSQQVAQPDLSSALLMFRRAASVIARVEDAIVFRGQTGVDQNSPFVVKPDIYSVRAGGKHRGLFDTDNKQIVRVDPDSGNSLVSAAADAVAILEGVGHMGPYAMVLGQRLFVTAETPNPGSLVLPSDRIKPLIEGPLLRSGTLKTDTGVVVSLGGDPVDLAVGSEICVRFLQVTPHPAYIYRVSERIALRVKEPEAIVNLVPKA